MHNRENITGVFWSDDMIELEKSFVDKLIALHHLHQ